MSFLFILIFILLPLHKPLHPLIHPRHPLNPSSLLPLPFTLLLLLLFFINLLLLCILLLLFLCNLRFFPRLFSFNLYILRVFFFLLLCILSILFILCILQILPLYFPSPSSFSPSSSSPSYSSTSSFSSSSATFVSFPSSSPSSVSVYSIQLKQHMKDKDKHRTSKNKSTKLCESHIVKTLHEVKWMKLTTIQSIISILRSYTELNHGEKKSTKGLI